MKKKQELEGEALRARNRKLLARFPSLLSFILVYIGSLIVPTLFFIVFDTEGTESSNKTLSILLSMSGMLLFFVILARAFTRKKERDLTEVIAFYPKDISAKTYGLLAASGFCINLAQSALVALIPLPEALVGEYAEKTSSVIATDSLLISILYTVVFAPVFEEIFYRGFMFDALKKGFGSWTVIVVLGVAFGLPHLHPIWVVLTVVNGFYMTLLRELYGSLSVSITIHVFYNLASLPILLTQGTSVYTILFDNVIAELIILAICGTIAYFTVSRLIKEGPNKFYLKRKEAAEV